MGKGGKRRRSESKVSHDEVAGYAQTEFLFKSNLFKLQTAELIKEVTPAYGAATSGLEGAVRVLRSRLTALPTAELCWERPTQPGRGAAVGSHAHLERHALRGERVAMPWRPPAAVALVGSYLLRTSTAPEFNLDLTVQLPAGMFLQKDFLDGRYADKRSLYLAHLGHLLRGTAVGECTACTAEDDALVREVRFAALPHQQSHEWPVLELVLGAAGAEAEAAASAEFGGWVVRLIPCITRETFAWGKLRPQRCNLREAGDLPSAAYNNLLRLESGYGAALSLAHATFARDGSGALREAAVLLKVWLGRRTRGQAGSVTGFQLTLVLIYLLSTRVPPAGTWSRRSFGDVD
jgi:U3 small nucleolar RNA-associated protein 22